ncbi:hypothetical protein GWK48_02430 [Metallosphaera tengchongensis]|uniref:Calcium binding protein SSO6904 domain-containing protein n=1 Tax=Metallosphaera tengchongensis TaxID=1532350 RepID=A0A6N0NU25_9CREN|nr:hypothetical protein [Metallosphaera tengchongensis]QKQ99402.1 hypothetical protein GWK48_02430 [Metallosphaera tengchongensis]
MSILDQEEFVKLRLLKPKVDIKEVQVILDEVEAEAKRGNNVKSALIFAYANHLDLVKKNRDLFNLIGSILEKYTPKLGVENVIELILNSLS